MNKMNQWKKKVYFAETMYKIVARISIEKFIWLYMMAFYYNKKILKYTINN